MFPMSDTPAIQPREGVAFPRNAPPDVPQLAIWSPSLYISINFQMCRIMSTGQWVEILMRSEGKRRSHKYWASIVWITFYINLGIKVFLFILLKSDRRNGHKDKECMNEMYLANLSHGIQIKNILNLLLSICAFLWHFYFDGFKIYFIKNINNFHYAVPFLIKL